MRNLNKVLMSAIANDGDKVSAAIDASQIYAISIVGSFTDGSAAGTLKLQGSNDVPPDQSAPPAFTPTNWADIPNGSVAVSSGATSTIDKTSLCYRWVRVAWTRSGGAGTFTVRGNTQGF
jgi:hypothetical protein